MDIFDYIKKYGCYTFKEVWFNEVDNVIFSLLSYVNLEKYVSNNRFNKRTIQDVGKDFFRDYDKNTKNITAIRNGIDTLNAIRNTRRYGNLLLYNYTYVADSSQQFSAVTIQINSHLVYVSYEGTDHLISGWKEDFMMSYTFPVSAQRKAIDYLNRKFLFNNKDIIIGGHSKGGNLAIVAGMYANNWVKDRIINIYNNDGPGFRKNEIESNEYKTIEKKIIHIIPNYSIIGLLLRHDENYIVVKSTKRNIYAHALVNWVVDENIFKRAGLSRFSKLLDDGMIKWLDKYNDAQRERFVDTLFMVFDRANVVSLNDILENKKLIFKLIMETKGIDKETRNMLKEFIYVLFNYFKDTTIMPMFDKYASKNS